MNDRIEYYAKELNVLCIGVCLLVVCAYWVQQLSPDLYAVIQVIIESFSITSFDDSAGIDFATN